MEFSEEFIQQNGLNQEQINAVLGEVSNHISTLEADWSAKANTNAEGIITGAAESVEKLTGIKREKGQKIADYLKTASENYFSGKTSTLEQKERELEDKIKKSGASESLLAELQETKDKLKVLQEKEAVFADWEENNYKGKYEELLTEVEQSKVNSAFGSIKPEFPENVNKFEADYKWNNFVNSVLEKNNIKFDEKGVPIAVDKENQFKVTKLADLLKKDTELTQLIDGKKVEGFGGRKATMKIDGIPFDVPEKATSKERTQLIKEYLSSQGLDPISNEYAQKFSELNKKIISPKTA